MHAHDKCKLECPVCEKEIYLDSPFEGMTGTCTSCNTHLEVTCEYIYEAGLVFNLIEIE